MIIPAPWTTNDNSNVGVVVEQNNSVDNAIAAYLASIQNNDTNNAPADGVKDNNRVDDNITSSVLCTPLFQKKNHQI